MNDWQKNKNIYVEILLKVELIIDKFTLTRPKQAHFTIKWLFYKNHSDTMPFPRKCATQK